MKQYTYKITETHLLDANNNCLLEFDSIKSLYKLFIDKNIIPDKIKNFGRLSHLSKQEILLTAYLLNQHPLSDAERKEIFLFATDSHAATSENYNYFTDYYNSGATLGRGNLFVYTLPSSPLADVAIALKLAGPLLYLAPLREHQTQLIHQGTLYCQENNISKGLLFYRDDNQKYITVTLLEIAR